MKKIYLIVFTVFLNVAVFSCSPENTASENIEEVEVPCCGDDGDIIPPPPPEDD